ncbi:hypothetical protein T11_7110 [Trichinella zimbabwensis]|uniref:Uncharacterized protein n=1 Tax=Trichinella zimbabwensis TaxID=268475 RepID=A0A0V1GKU2_9BILA|nr:hypothetical protein T11_7110 [Trichinella zimbabwensis]
MVSSSSCSIIRLIVQNPADQPPVEHQEVDCKL